MGSCVIDFMLPGTHISNSPNPLSGSYEKKSVLEEIQGLLVPGVKVQWLCILGSLDLPLKLG
jgi:hypothetical protein